MDPPAWRLRARVAVDDWTVEAVRPVLCLPNLAAATGEGLVLLGNGLRRDLPRARHEVPPDWTGPILAHLPSRPTATSLRLAVERARAGAHLCLVGLELASVKRVGPLVGLPLAIHGARGNFMGMHHYLRDHPLFADVGAPCLADSTFAEVLPARSASVPFDPSARPRGATYRVARTGRGP